MDYKRYFGKTYQGKNVKNKVLTQNLTKKTNKSGPEGPIGGAEEPHRCSQRLQPSTRSRKSRL